MSDLVSPDAVEAIVGAERHDTEHIGRAVSSEATVYILHSRECKDSGIDPRDCPFSVALDRGIESAFPWTGWRRVQNRPTRLEVVRGYLMPDFADYRDARAAAAAPVPAPATDGPPSAPTGEGTDTP